MKSANDIMIEKIKKYIASRLAPKLELFDKKAKKILKENGYNSELSIVSGQEQSISQLIEKLQKERIELQEKYNPVKWLNDAASRAGQISLVTHAPKYTHSDTKSTGVFLQYIKPSPNYWYLCSGEVRNLVVDVVGNAAALDVANLLLLEVDGKTLLDEIRMRNSPALAYFAPSTERLNEWLEGFGGAFAAKDVKSGQLSKQLYFPISDGNYHLISPLYATSFSQIVYEKIHDVFYSETAKNARKAYNNKKYNGSTAVFYSNIAKQSFGGTKPQNISQLNTTRRGKGYLLSCQPPVWQKRITPPVESKNSFWREYERRALKTAKTLQQYLEKIFTRSSTFERRDTRAELVDKLIDILLIYAAEVQNLKEFAGWSIASKLSNAEQLWLDPYRAEIDEEFKHERAKNNWQKEISQQFATWLNYKISYQSKILHADDATFIAWQKLLEKKLLLLKDDLGGVD